MEITIRPVSQEDIPACGTICFEAFKGIAERHGFQPDFPSPDIPIGLLSALNRHPGFYGVTAEIDGVVVGSIFVDERGSVGGIGPVTVAPAVQNRGIGRRLMEHVIARAEASGGSPLRLTQAAYHARSLSLYAKLGFRTREPLCVMQGQPPKSIPAGRLARSATIADREACSELCRRVHGHGRDGELADAVEQGSAIVVEEEGRITGYSTLIGYFGHAVAESDDDLKALIAAADTVVGPGFLLPAGNGNVLRWCLDNSMRVLHVATLMTRGDYREPKGAYLPSILY